MARLKVGIAGYGIVGKRRHECLDKHPRFETVAVCDRNFPTDATLPSGIRAFTNYRALLDLPLDVLIVCMSNDMAAEVTIAGLEKGLHVFCEKPPARTLEELSAVLETERGRPNQRLMYGFNHRYHGSVQDALAIIRSGELGSIINLRGLYGKSKLITFNQPDWRAKRELAGGGVLLDQGIHMVDLMRLFAGEFDEVHSVVSNSHWGYDVEDNAYALMKTSAGVVALFNSSATQWRHQFSLDINLERGSLLLRGILTSSKSYGSETLTIVHADPDRDNGDPVESARTYKSDPSWDSEIAALAEAIDTGTAPDHGTSRDAFLTMSLVNSIYHADEQWRTRHRIPDPKKYSL